MKQMMMVLAIVGALAAPAAAQVITPINPLYREGTAYLAAKAVTTVTDNTTSKVMSFSLTLLNNTTVVVNLNYATPIPGQIYLNPPINPTVAQLMKMLADKKKAEPSNFYSFYMNPVKWRSFGGVYEYWVTRSTIVTLDAVIPNVFKATQNTRGGLVRAVVYDGAIAGADGVAFSSYGYVTLQRNDGTLATPMYREFDAYMLRAPYTTPEGTTLQPLTNATTFLSDALVTRKLVILNGAYSPYKIIDARIVYDMCTWTILY